MGSVIMKITFLSALIFLVQYIQMKHFIVETEDSGDSLPKQESGSNYMNDVGYDDYGQYNGYGEDDDLTNKTNSYGDYVGTVVFSRGPTIDHPTTCYSGDDPFFGRSCVTWNDCNPDKSGCSSCRKDKNFNAQTQCLRNRNCPRKCLKQLPTYCTTRNCQTDADCAQSEPEGNQVEECTQCTRVGHLVTDVAFLSGARIVQECKPQGTPHFDG